MNKYPQYTDPRYSYSKLIPLAMVFGRSYTSENNIILEYLDTSSEDIMNESKAAAYDISTLDIRRCAVLRFTDIGPIETPVHAWLRYLCHLNGLEFELPVPTALADAIVSCAPCHRFMYWLA